MYLLLQHFVVLLLEYTAFSQRPTLNCGVGHTAVFNVVSKVELEPEVWNLCRLVLAVTVITHAVSITYCRVAVAHAKEDYYFHLLH